MCDYAVNETMRLLLTGEAESVTIVFPDREYAEAVYEEAARRMDGLLRDFL
jgi:hypothetical protein